MLRDLARAIGPYHLSLLGGMLLLYESGYPISESIIESKLEQFTPYEKPEDPVIVSIPGLGSYESPLTPFQVGEVVVASSLLATYLVGTSIHNWNKPQEESID